ncbi:MAG TPA: sulfatase-like hydrolase/transferase [Sedimentisphaerales bacterium]|nr:sulfatase-like hydrolase/transferase [Sedimentisphaerales bacterium]
MISTQDGARKLDQYFGLTYIVLLLNTSLYLKYVDFTGFWVYPFTAAVYFAYCFIYMLPFIIILQLFRKFVCLSFMQSFLQKLRLKPMWLLYILAVSSITFLQIFIFTDRFIFNMYDFHINGFVWNLLTTPGGIESMGGDPSTTLTFIMIIAGFLAIQSALLLLMLNVRKFENFSQRVFSKLNVNIAIIIFILLGLFQAAAYGISYVRSYDPILISSEAFPLYIPVTFTKLAKSLGMDVKRQPQKLEAKDNALGIDYPLNPITRAPGSKNYNIVWLVAESLRADMLDANIMPETWAFSQKAISFQNHYSGGNGTRMAMFAMFYGLYGNYWFSFLNEERSPVLIDLLIENNYQMDMFSSAKFSYPEFDKTIFVRLPKSQLHDDSETTGSEGWQKDRQNVAKLLDFLKTRDHNRPFMTFMFFESPHARYYFPPENIIRPDYLKEFNYATVNLNRDIQLIKNRYINSCNHLDSQFAVILQYLEQSNLLDDTIVIITGDHGEEFMEKGRWGHNSAFTEEQTRSPLVLWAPGEKPYVTTQMSSHLDIPVTVMSLLGVANPPSDYSLGFNLLGGDYRKFTVISGWNTLAYVDDEYKAVFPTGLSGLSKQKVTMKNDIVVKDNSDFYRKKQGNIIQIMKELAHFQK